MAVIRTLCGQCSVGCGLRATPFEDGLMVEGDRMHPANGGLLCPVGEALAGPRRMEGRLLGPLVDGRAVGWDRAIAQAARRLRDVIGRHGPGSVALHVGGDLTTEDYYAANKLMKGFIGSAHIDAPWSTDGAMVAHRRIFGEDVVPAALEDVDRADLILVVGARGLDDHPVLEDRVRAAGDEKAHLVLIGTGGSLPDGAIRLPAPRGSEARLLAGLLRHCWDAGLLDLDWLARHVAVPDGFWAGLQAGHDLWSVARACGLSPAELRAFYDLFAASRATVTLFNPLDEPDALAAAILNLHVATGRIGRPGCVPFALATSANAMGGREVGCMASILAAHQPFSPDVVARVARFWAAPAMSTGPGLEGEALLQAIRDGEVRALWSLGGADTHWLREAAHHAPLVLLSTGQQAMAALDGVDIAFPSADWAERDGTLTSADRLIGRQRRIFPLAGEAKPHWWIVTRLAQAMGWRDAFHYERPADIYREHVRLTAYHNEGGRLLDLRRHAPISNPAYEELTPWRWGELPFDGGRFPTVDGRARLVPSWE
ncbi:molybdopterin oxidoreductase family protein [Sphingobium ummariense]|nr:molybdopterin-dependent oxidoreductase [Sphingobium ummariense]